ncbi:TPA: hypothetical protein ACH3X2_009048 [Trebouxia sp. C0005]
MRLAAVQHLYGRPAHIMCSKVQVCDSHLHYMSMEHTAAAAKPITAAKNGIAASAFVTGLWLSFALCVNATLSSSGNNNNRASHSSNNSQSQQSQKWQCCKCCDRHHSL